MTLPDFAKKPWAVQEDAFGDETAIVVDDEEYRDSRGAVTTQMVEVVGQAGVERFDRAIAAHIVQLHNEWLVAVESAKNQPQGGSDE